MMQLPEHIVITLARHLQRALEGERGGKRADESVRLCRRCVKTIIKYYENMKEKNAIQTRKNEQRFRTDVQAEMLGKYVAKTVTADRIEHTIDTDTGEVIELTRTDIICGRGTLIDQDTAQELMFHIKTGLIDGVDVSNQKRMGRAVSRNPSLYTCKVRHGSKNKTNYLLYGTSVEEVCDIVTDFCELHLDEVFQISNVKLIEGALVLADKYFEIRKILDHDMQDEVHEEDDILGMKFHRLSLDISYDDRDITGKNIVHKTDEYSVIVYAANVDDGVDQTYEYLKEVEEERKAKSAIENKLYEPKVYDIAVNSGAPISIGAFIPIEFSKTYYSPDEMEDRS